MSAESEVRAASETFYSALNRMAAGESGTMSGIWSHGAQASAFHPIGGRDVGWEKISDSFEQVANVGTGGEIKLTDQVIQIAGDMACEAGTEKGYLSLSGLRASIDQRVTNVYRREGGNWKMIHHHADLSPAMMDVLAKLQAKA